MLTKSTLPRFAARSGRSLCSRSSVAPRRPRPCTRSARPQVLTSRTSRPSTIRSAARRPPTTSNTTTVAVAEMLNVTIALQSPTVSVAAGASNEALLFLVTNTGNSAETFTLAGDSVLVGDDFDPTPAAPFIYFDSDNSGDLSPADTPYVAGSNDPAARGRRKRRGHPRQRHSARRCPTASAAAASSARRPTRAPARRAPCSRAMAAAASTPSSARAAAKPPCSASTSSATSKLSAVKSQSMLDPFGGSQPMPGAAISYQIVVTATGTGAALGAALTRRDSGEHELRRRQPELERRAADRSDRRRRRLVRVRTGAASPSSLGDLTAAAGPQTIDFRVTID